MDMQLEEKYKQWLETYPRPSLRDIECAKIAENFAIGFSEWYFTNKPKYDAGHLFEGVKLLTTKQLLEIYKKTL